MPGIVSAGQGLVGSVSGYIGLHSTTHYHSVSRCLVECSHVCYHIKWVWRGVVEGGGVWCYMMVCDSGM